MHLQQAYERVRKINRTVYCSFDHRDLADLAMGKLRNSVSKIKSISYIKGSENYGDDFDIAMPIPVGTNAGMGMGIADGAGVGGALPFLGFIPTAGYHNNTGVRPSRPVTAKIVCDESVVHQVTSKLVNLHAYRIVSA